MTESGDHGGRLWRGLRALIFGDAQETSLRAQIEEAIDDHEGERDTPMPHAGDRDLSAIERQMLRNLLHFGEMTADDVAVPRADIFAIADTASFDQLVAKFAEAGHSRLPVYHGDLDSIVGMIHVKDVFEIMAKNRKPPAKITKLMRQPRFVPQSMGVLDLLADMRSHRTHLAIVLDEYSGTEGLVTIEDLVEEIVGDIEDEHDDEPERLLLPLDGGLYDADARVELEDLAQEVDERLGRVDEDIETLGGLAVVMAGGVPEKGAILTHDSGWRIEITQADDRRVQRVLLHPPVDTVADDQ